ncbi:hypothetical protein ACSBR1_020020 [Camellia fascicularis]
MSSNTISSQKSEPFSSLSSEVVLIIEEFDGLVGNQIYKAAQIYLGSKISLNTQLYKVSIPEKETKISTSMAKKQSMIDNFNGSKWKLNPSKLCTRINTQPRHHDQKIDILNSYSIKKHKNIVFDSYFPVILKETQNLKDGRKALKIHTLNNAHAWMYSGMSYTWDLINLDHPSTFETLAMDAEMKRMVTEDLERFVRRKDFYRRVGKAWKRGKLLIATANRCILVVEDIDCSIDLEDQRDAEEEVLRMLQSNEVTLSGLLNFINGLWSSCGDEQIIMFTTNHKERLDPALLRLGWMDVHIHMSYCSPCGFKTLAANYLGLNDHSFS